MVPTSPAKQFPYDKVARDKPQDLKDVQGAIDLVQSGQPRERAKTRRLPATPEPAKRGEKFIYDNIRISSGADLDSQEVHLDRDLSDPSSPSRPDLAQFVARSEHEENVDRLIEPRVMDFEDLGLGSDEDDDFDLGERVRNEIRDIRNQTKLSSMLSARKHSLTLTSRG